MKTRTIRTEIKNYSRFDIDLVWENAQDIEHLAFLHSATNDQFHLLHSSRQENSRFAYDVLIYRAVRKFFFFKFNAFGFRMILKDYQIQQVEYIPALHITQALNSLLRQNQDKEFPTEMLDEVVMEVPPIFFWLKRRLIAALKRHTAIQCAQDEPFRQRRKELKERKINIPFSLFNESAFLRLTRQFANGGSGK
jgi:hypothetical protein